MSRIYTDKVLMIATQLAYCNWEVAYSEMGKRDEADITVRDGRDFMSGNPEM